MLRRFGQALVFLAVANLPLLVGNLLQAQPIRFTPPVNTLTVDPCSEDGDCDDGNPCTKEYCDVVIGACIIEPLPFSTLCEADNNECTVDHCDGNGACVFLSYPPAGTPCGSLLDTECDDPDTCGPGVCMVNQMPLSMPCEADGNLCTIDHCDGNGQCVLNYLDPCDDDNPCTEDICIPEVGCAHLALPWSTWCEADGDLCTIDHCDGGGSCIFLGPVVCDDSNPCTDEYCDPANGICVYVPLPLSTPCEADGDLCTIDHCDGNGVCIYKQDVDCNDFNPCTEDHCLPEGYCFNPLLALSTPCEADGDICTIDHCDGNGACVFLRNVDCDDGNPCTEEWCDPALGCVYAYLPFSTPCDVDGNFCTVDHCDGQGNCVMLWFDDCNDDNPCTDDYCDVVVGACVHVPSQYGTQCEADGYSCTIDHCDGNGVCVFLQGGTVKSHQKISNTEGGFTGTLNDWDVFGNSMASLGDFDDDGIGDIVVGARGDDGAGWERGAVWVLLLNSDGSVKSHQKISDTEGGFTGTLDDEDYFGISVASLGDLDGDDLGDIVVGAFWDDDGGYNRGAVWVLFLNADGTVKSHQKISDTEGGFTGTLDDEDYFGVSVASVGDLDSDGATDIAVGAVLDDDGGANRGAVWVLFLNPDGTVKVHQKISNSEGGFGGTLDDGDQFGSVTSVGDFDGDGVGDIAARAYADDDGGYNRGAVWMLFLNGDGTVKSHQKISNTEGGFTGTLNDEDYFGLSVALLGNFDGDGTGDIIVGAHADDDGGYNRGAVWMLLLNGDGTVKSHKKISDIEGGFNGTLEDEDYFGVSLASLGDLDGDGAGDIAVGAHWDDDGGYNRGAVWVLSLCKLCDDNNACTADEAIPNDGCIHPPRPDYTPCDGDGNVCTIDHCDGNGSCVYSQNLDCDDGNACTEDFCDQAAGCFFPTADCDDGDGCTIDTCDSDAGCAYHSIDLTGDGRVDAFDLALLLGSWGSNPGHPADFNEDGFVNAADLAMLLGAWGPCW